jgi:hypothetical protein
MGKTLELGPLLMDEVTAYVSRLGFISCSDLQQRYRISFSAATSLKKRLLEKMDLLSAERLPSVSYRLVDVDSPSNAALEPEIAIVEIKVAYLSWTSSALLVASPEYVNRTAAKECLRSLSRSWAVDTAVGLSYFDFCRFIGGSCDKPNRIVRVADFNAEGRERVANTLGKLTAASDLSENLLGAQDVLLVIHADQKNLKGSELKQIATGVSSLLKPTGRIYLSLVDEIDLPADALNIDIFLSFDSPQSARWKFNTELGSNPRVTGMKFA